MVGRGRSLGVVSWLVLAAAVPPASEAADTPALAAQAHAILKKYCYRCHGVRFEVPGYNVLDRDLLVARRGEGETPYIVPGKPDESELWIRAGIDTDMPPEKSPRPSAAEREALRSWIVAGAAFPRLEDARPIKGYAGVLASIRDHLRGTRPVDRPFQRYFSMTELWNNPNLGEDELRLARAGLSKLLNSLSWKHELVIPAELDRDRTIFVVDLRDLGWQEDGLYDEIASAYPYGLTHDRDNDPKVRAVAEEVSDLAGSDMPVLRMDWFIASASRPPLYHEVLGLPKTAAELEAKLEVRAENDFLRNTLARAGFATSGVSSQNRVVDRHQAVHGAYWKSYDFKRNDETGDIFRFPLGPLFEGNPFRRQAFEHAGGEIIFSLPNGMQGYLLVNAQGARIDEGPIDIVGDALKTSGTAAIVNGLSCMACHQNGMIRFKDTVRSGQSLGGSAREKVEQLYREPQEMDRYLARDEGRFLKVLDAVCGKFLKQDDDREKSIREFPEPIGAMARLYLKDLKLDDVAAELGQKPEALKVTLENNPTLQQMGLSPLIRGAAIKRTEWDSLKGRTRSTYQRVASELRVGVPFRVLSSRSAN